MSRNKSLFAAILIAACAVAVPLVQAQTLSPTGWPYSLATAPTNVTTDAVKIFTITNTGTASMASLAITVTGTGFTKVTTTADYTCGTSLAAAASCTFPVVFEPTTAGATPSAAPPSFTGSVSVAYKIGTTSAAPLVATLSGYSVEPYCIAADAPAGGFAATTATYGSVVAVAPVLADSATIKVMAGGSSAMWATMALGAYNAGLGVTGATAPTSHWVGGSKLNYIDSRPAAAVADAGTTWIVWDSAYKSTTYSYTNYARASKSPKCFAAQPNVWAFGNLDSVIGNREFFGNGAAQAPSGFNWASMGGSISAVAPYLWGNCPTTASNYSVKCDVQPPAVIQAAFNAPSSVPVNVGATDIRPEDAMYATTRVNATLGGGSDGLEGLGYGVNAPDSPLNGDPNASCVAPSSTGVGTAAHGSQIKEDYTATGAFNVLAFNIHGNDPITCNPVRSYKVIPIGAAPITFIYSKKISGSPLAGLQNASEYQLQQVFSGQNVNASAFGLTAGSIAAYLREPLSGTYNTIEQTIFRHPSAQAEYRFSQETNCATLPCTKTNESVMPNPIAGTDVSGSRFRAIGTGNEVKSVLNGYKTTGTIGQHGLDGIGYTFFSYANVNPIANDPGYGYIQVNDVDPIWHQYGIQIDPGQPSVAGMLPNSSVAQCIASNNANGFGSNSPFPCAEGQLWASDPDTTTLDTVWTTTGFLNHPMGGSNGLSFPNLRNGSYSAWSLLRLIADTTTTNGQNAYTNATALVAMSNMYAVASVPDYVPYAKVICPTNTTVNGIQSACTAKGILDPGLPVIHSHYGCAAADATTTTTQALQRAICGVNLSGIVVKAADATDLGRDAGGSVIQLSDVLLDYTLDGPDGGFVPFVY